MSYLIKFFLRKFQNNQESKGKSRYTNNRLHQEQIPAFCMPLNKMGPRFNNKRAHCMTPNECRISFFSAIVLHTLHFDNSYTTRYKYISDNKKNQRIYEVYSAVKKTMLPLITFDQCMELILDKKTGAIANETTQKSRVHFVYVLPIVFKDLGFFDDLLKTLVRRTLDVKDMSIYDTWKTIENNVFHIILVNGYKEAFLSNVLLSNQSLHHLLTSNRVFKARENKPSARPEPNKASRRSPSNRTVPLNPAEKAPEAKAETKAIKAIKANKAADTGAGVAPVAPVSAASYNTIVSNGPKNRALLPQVLGSGTFKPVRLPPQRLSLYIPTGHNGKPYIVKPEINKQVHWGY